MTTRLFFWIGLAGALIAAASVHAEAAQASAPNSARSEAPATAPAPPNVSIRVAPSSDRRLNIRLIEQYERYFQASEVTLPRSITAAAFSMRQCGRVDSTWLARFAEANGVRMDAPLPAGARLLVAPCPFWSLDGTAVVDKGETASGELLRTVGQAGPAMVARVARMNNMSAAELERTKPRDLKVPFVTSRASHTVKPQYRGDVDAVIRSLAAFPGSSARREVTLSLVGAGPVDCDPAGGTMPFEPERIAALLERNASIQSPFRKTTVAVIDTGIDVAEQRLFLGRDANGSVGANMDPRLGDFPTTPDTYQWRAHGTHVAGLVLGGLQSPRLTALVKERIQLKIVNIVARDVFPDSTGAPRESFNIPLSNLQEAIAYARRDPPIPILNLSVKTDAYLESMLNGMKDGEYLAVLAAGNDHQDIGVEPIYPAGFSAVLPTRFLTVASHDAGGGLSDFSNRGNAVNLAAPGCRITSIVPATVRAS